LHKPPEPGGRGIQDVASYFLSTTPASRIGLFRLGSNSLNQAGTAIAVSLEQVGKRVLLLRGDYQRDGANLIAISPEGLREGPIVEWKTCNDRLRREERASDILLFLLHPKMPLLPRLLPLLNLLVLLLPGEKDEALDAYRLAKNLLLNHWHLPVGLLAAGESAAATAVLDRFLLGIRTFLGITPVNFGTTAHACAREIANLKLDTPAEAYFLGNT
jgi:hypothetical protein